MHRPSLAVALWLLGLALPVRASAAALWLEDFEGADPLKAWSLYLGLEFPGAKGTLTAVTSEGNTAARLSFDLSCSSGTTPCDPHYISAEHVLVTPVSEAEAARVRVRGANAAPTLRVVDSTGQTLQYDSVGTLPLEASDLGAWWWATFDLAQPSGHWGGDNDGLVHGAITRLSVLVDAVDRKAPGTMDFDDLALLASRSDLAPALTLERTSTPSLPLPADRAELAPRLGVAVHFTEDADALDAIASAGFTWIRRDLVWAAVDDGTRFNWTGFDHLLDEAQKRGLKVLWILDYGHPKFTGGDKLPPTTPGAQARFELFAQTAAAHYAGRAVAFEVWNEPDLAGFWQPAPSAADYSVLLAATVAALRRGDPSAFVMSGGLSFPGPFQYQFVQTVLDSGALADVDGLGMHLYVWSAPESRWPDVLRLRARVASLPKAPDLWCTEWGHSSSVYAADGDGHAADGRMRQAVQTVRELLTSWIAGLPLVTYYDIRDDGDDPLEKEHNFGLLARDYSPKPAMVAVRTLTATAQGRRLTRLFTPAEASNVHLALLEGDADVLVAWSQASGVPTTLTVSEPVLWATDMMGQTLEGTHTGSATNYTLDEALGPIYLRLARPAADAGTVGSDSGTGSGDDSGTRPGGDSGGPAADAGREDDGGGAPDARSPTAKPASCGCTQPTGPVSAGCAAVLAATLLARRRRR